MYDHLRAVTMIGAFFMYPDPRHCRRSVGSIEGARRCAKVATRPVDLPVPVKASGGVLRVQGVRQCFRLCEYVS